MMERIVLALVCLSGCHISCLQYHYVAEPKTWTEAQTYCRQTHTDLATLGNADHVNQFLDTVTSAGYHSEVWIGLYTEINWKWSDGFSGSGADYRSWDMDEPKFFVGDNEFCVRMLYEGGWDDFDCSGEQWFFCYSGSQENPQFVPVKEEKTWSEAQRHCRENYIDLATVRDQTQNNQLVDLLDFDNYWIGLYRDPNFYWSDGSSYSFSDWDIGFENPLDSMKVVCGVSSVGYSGKWMLSSCEDTFPFVCYSLPKPVSSAVKKQLVKLRMTLKDSSVDLNDPAVRAQLLEQLQDRLKRNNVTGVTLKWNQGPDGKVFHKEEEGSQETEREKDEL